MVLLWFRTGGGDKLWDLSLKMEASAALSEFIGRGVHAVCVGVHEELVLSAGVRLLQVFHHQRT